MLFRSSPRKASFLQEWGCELTRGDLLEPASLDYALEGQEAVIDAATARATDSGSAWPVDWTGKQNLFAACGRAGVKRVVFHSLLGAERHPRVPLMAIKACSEQLPDLLLLDLALPDGDGLLVAHSFALLNPLGMLTIFINFTARQSKAVQQLVALFVAVTVLALVLLFMVTGTGLLQFFGISLDSFRIAGGILLLGLGIGIVNGEGTNTLPVPGGSAAEESKMMQAQSVYRQIVIPMAMPLLVGPGVIANVILYSSDTKRLGWERNLELMLTAFVVSVLVFIVLASAKSLQRFLGEIGRAHV